MVLSATALRCMRARSWLRRAKPDVEADDLHAGFIFLWIALNALYGQAKYRLGQDERTAEFEDSRQFADRMSRLDHEALQRVLRDTRLEIQRLLDDRYLDNKCWARWDAWDNRQGGARRNLW